MAGTENLADYLARLDADLAGFGARHDAIVARFASVDPVAHEELIGRLTLRNLADLAAERFRSGRLRRAAAPDALSREGRTAMATTKFRVQFTIDGNNVGDRIAPPGGIDRPVNDVHFEFQRGRDKPKISFTKDGEVLPKGTKEAPDGATGVGIEFGEDEGGHPRIKWMHWTQRTGDGEPAPIGFEWAPPGANDFHLVLGQGGLITKAWWTYNGHKLAYGGDVAIPKYPVNDVHLLPVGVSLSAAIDYRQLAVALLTTVDVRADYVLPLADDDGDDVPPLPEELLADSINYLYKLRSFLATLPEREKRKVRRRLRRYRRQVENSTTLSAAEKADLLDKIDKTLEAMG